MKQKTDKVLLLINEDEILIILKILIILIKPNKQTIEVCFSQKYKKVNYSSLFFNDDKVQSVPSQKHLGLILDSKLDFNEHIKSISWSHEPKIRKASIFH